MKEVFKVFWAYFFKMLVIMLIHGLIFTMGFIVMGIKNNFWVGFLCVIFMLAYFAAVFFFSMRTGITEHKRLIKRLNTNFKKPPASERAKEYAFYRGITVGLVYLFFIAIFVVIAALTEAVGLIAVMGIWEAAFVGLLSASGYIIAEAGGAAALLLLIPSGITLVVYSAGYIFGGWRGKNQQERFIAHKRRVGESTKNDISGSGSGRFIGRKAETGTDEETKI